MSDIKIVPAPSPYIGELVINATSFDQAVEKARRELEYEPEYRHYHTLLLELTSLEIVGKHYSKMDMSEHTYRFRVLEGR